MTEQELDDVARLILMEMHDESPGRPSAVEFVARLKQEAAGVSLVEAMAAWRKYMGIDGHGQTHYFESGAPIR